MATSGMTGGLTGRKDHSSGVRNGSSGGRSLPAFTIYEISVQEISDRLRLLLGQGSFTITMVRKSVISVRLRGLNDFEKVRLMLSERGYKFLILMLSIVLKRFLIARFVWEEIGEGMWFNAIDVRGLVASPLIVGCRSDVSSVGKPTIPGSSQSHQRLNWKN